MLTDYATNRDSWISLAIGAVNKSLAKASASAKEPASKEKAPPALIDRKEAKNLFIRMLYPGGTGEWSKEVGFKGSIPKVENLRLELKRIGKSIVKNFSALLHVVLVVVTTPRYLQAKTHFLGLSPSSWVDIENKCLMAAIAYIELLCLGAVVLVYAGLMVHYPDKRICAEVKSERVFDATGYRVI